MIADIDQTGGSVNLSFLLSPLTLFTGIPGSWAFSLRPRLCHWLPWFSRPQIEPEPWWTSNSLDGPLAYR